MVDLAAWAGAGIAEGRAPVLGARAMVASPSGWASAIGLEVLRGGGSAVDAAVAVGAALMVAQPHQCGLGGDAFWLIRGGTGTTEALNASGRAPAGASLDELRARGATEIPLRSGEAVTVPGVVSGWFAAHARHGRWDLERLLAPAAEGAERGLAVSPLFARQLAASAAMLATRPESARTFLPGGAAPRVGDVLAQPELARTLRRLGADPAGFYGGDLAEAIARAVRDAGGWMTADDLAAHRADWEEPVRAPFAGWTVEEMGPNSQGLAALIGLDLLAHGGLPGIGDDEGWAHRGVEAARVLMAVRDAELADPAAMIRTPAALLGDAYLGPLRELLGGVRPLRGAEVAERVGEPAAGGPPAPRGDTVHFAVVDGDGLAVSCIQSVFHDFGSGIVVPGTGILLHNRGSSFTLERGHVNALAPGKRPMHTLAPGMATAQGRTAAVFGSMGGHAQAQLHVQLVGAMAGRGLDPATAIARARWFVPPGDPEGDVVEVEDRGPLAGLLAARGHHVRRVPAFAQDMGHAQAILVDHASGVLIGATDPRSDGVALGF